MTIHFVVPPAAQREGGLDAALESLRLALAEAGRPAADGLPAVGAEAGAVAHFHGLWQPSYQPLAAECRARGIPYVASPHGMLEPWAWRHKWWKKWPYFWLRERGFLRGAAAVLATAEPEAKNLRRRVPGARVEVLPLGLTGAARPDYAAARQALGWAEGTRVLLYLSRIHPKKGLHLLLQALAKIPLSAEAPLRLVVVGDGEEAYLRQLRQLAAAVEARGIPVAWEGARWGAARWPYFQGADLFCLPTHSENFGLAVLEALQVGTPVLTTYETPWHGQVAPPAGWLCAPTAEDTGRALHAWQEFPWQTLMQRHELGTWARARFSWPTLAPRYLELYQKCASIANSTL